ncbi:unnamed protein product [marine sediment metagenome]|uniref:Uncharacterized protein n=1 Tax=marine sediment metagenome TaxID=412755 RepID=X1BMW1_9ZZZZ
MFSIDCDHKYGQFYDISGWVEDSGWSFFGSILLKITFGRIGGRYFYKRSKQKCTVDNCDYTTNWVRYKNIKGKNISKSYWTQVLWDG